MNTPKPRLTPAQEDVLRACGYWNEKITSSAYKPAIKLAALGLIEPIIEKVRYANMSVWRITAAGRAWLAARERGNGFV